MQRLDVPLIKVLGVAGAERDLGVDVVERLYPVKVDLPRHVHRLFPSLGEVAVILEVVRHDFPRGRGAEHVLHKLDGLGCLSLFGLVLIKVLAKATFSGLRQLAFVFIKRGRERHTHTANLGSRQRDDLGDVLQRVLKYLAVLVVGKVENHRDVVDDAREQVGARLIRLTGRELCKRNLELRVRERFGNELLHRRDVEVFTQLGLGQSVVVIQAIERSPYFIPLLLAAN